MLSATMKPAMTMVLPIEYNFIPSLPITTPPDTIRVIRSMKYLKEVAIMGRKLRFSFVGFGKEKRNGGQQDYLII